MHSGEWTPADIALVMTAILLIPRRIRMGSEAARRVGLPPKPFLYTLDQLSFLLDVSEEYIKRSLLHYEGRSVGVAPRDKMVARNIAPAGEKPEWRVAERELVRWMRLKGFKYYERGYFHENDRRRE